MFDAKRTSNSIKYLKECEEVLKLPQSPYKDYYNKCECINFIPRRVKLKTMYIK